LRFEDILDGIPQRSVPARVRRYKMCVSLYIATGIGNSDSQSTVAHYGQIDYVIAYESGFIGVQSFVLQNFLEAGQFVLDTLVHMLQFQIAGAKSDGFRDALGDQPCLDATQASQRYRRAVVSVEALGFDNALAVQSESALATMLGGMFLCGLLRSGRCGKEKQLAVSEDTIYVEEQQFDFLGPRLGGEYFAHRRDSSTRLPILACRGDCGDLPDIWFG
jgi:hypothetical protein